MGKSMKPGDVVVIGDRPRGQRRAIELGAGVLVVSNGVRPDDEVLELARERGTAVVVSPLDSYVTSRLIQLSVPCWEVMSENPLTVSPDDLVTEITEQVMEVHYRAAIAVDDERVPIGVVTRTDLLNPKPRRVLLVDHAEIGQSVKGVEKAEVVEILDHHHVGDIETTSPIPATFDPVGSTATLIVERYRASGLVPEESTATMLLAALLSDTVILNSPTTTDRDREVAGYLEEMLDLDAEEFGTEMFEASSDVSSLSAEEIVVRDAKEYGTSSGDRVSVSQVETVGTGLLERKDELMRSPGGPARGERLPVLRADGHGHHGGRNPAPVRRGLLARAPGLRFQRPERRHRPARRDEPQEAGSPRTPLGPLGGSWRRYWTARLRRPRSAPRWPPRSPS